MNSNKELLSIALFFLVVCVLMTPIHAQENSKMVVRILPLQKSDLERLDDLDLDYAYYGLKDYVDVIVDQTQLDEIRARGFNYEMLPPIDKTNLFDPEYHTYEEMVAELDSLSQVYPAITELYEIGVSQQYQVPILSIKISDNADVDEDEFTVGYDGLHHAREPMGLEACMVLINHLLSNYGTDPQITEIVDNIEIWITPIVNPGGYKYLVDDDLSSPWWRKNLRDNNENGQFDPDSDGVDLNRNYDYYFTSGGSPDFDSWNYRGPYPFSESEIVAKRDLVLQQRFLCSISYHSYAEEIYYMRGLVGLTLPETPILDAFADSVASRIPKLSGVGHYEAGGRTHSSNMSYPWMFAVAGVYELLVEIGTEHMPPGNIALMAAEDNLPGAMYLLEKTISGPGIIGHVFDEISALPIEAEVKILQYYSSNMTPRKSESVYGRFHRFTEAGEYTLQVSAVGYKRKTVENVIVDQSGWTEVGIPLEYGATPVVDTFYVDDDSNGSSLGNGDGIVNIDETIELQIGLKNIGQSDADSVSAVLSSLSYFAAVLQDYQEFGFIPIDSTVNSQGKFVFKVDYRCPDGFRLPFRLHITGANGLDWDDEFYVPVSAPILDYERVVIYDSLGNDNGALEPGETVDLEVVVSNKGHMDATLVHSTLASSSGYIDFLDGIDTCDAIIAGEEGSVFFKIRLAESAPDPYIETFDLLLFSQEHYLRSQYFRLMCVAGFFDNMEYGENDWWHEVRGEPINTHDDWQWGIPQGNAGGEDPTRAYSGSYCWGNDLGREGWNGYYQHNVNIYLNSPVIDCSRFHNVGLKLMRWLNVRSGDQASILVNDQLIWSSPTSGLYDTQWTEQIVDISAIADSNSSVVISFGLTTDASLWAGGWNIDDVLVQDNLILSVAPIVDLQMPSRFHLFQNYPNPFNPMTTLRYDLPERAHVTLTIYDMLGREVKVLVSKSEEPGRKSVIWDGRDNVGQTVSSGVYIYRIEAGDFSQVKKMALLK